MASNDKGLPFYMHSSYCKSKCSRLPIFYLLEVVHISFFLHGIVPVYLPPLCFGWFQGKSHSSLTLMRPAWGLRWFLHPLEQGYHKVAGVTAIHTCFQVYCYITVHILLGRPTGSCSRSVSPTPFILFFFKEWFRLPSTTRPCARQPYTKVFIQRINCYRLPLPSGAQPSSHPSPLFLQPREY